MKNAAVGLMLVVGLGCGPSGSTTPPAEPPASPAPTADSETAVTPEPSTEESQPTEEPLAEGSQLVAVGDNESEDLEGADEGEPSEPVGRPVPRVRQAKAKVEGSLDKDIIRRIVRAHINEVRYCYNKQLQEHPEQKGRVVVKFTIGPNGNVDDAALDMTRPEDPQMTALGECTTERVRKWRFPKPPGAENVIVTYPFLFEPG